MASELEFVKTRRATMTMDSLIWKPFSYIVSRVIMLKLDFLKSVKAYFIQSQWFIKKTNNTFFSALFAGFWRVLFDYSYLKYVDAIRCFGPGIFPLLVFGCDTWELSVIANSLLFWNSCRSTLLKLALVHSPLGLLITDYFCVCCFFLRLHLAIGPLFER